MRLSVPNEIQSSFEFGGEECELSLRQPTRREYMLREQLLGKLWRDGTWTRDVEWASAVYFTLREVDLQKDDGTPLWDPMALKNGRLPWKDFLAGWKAIYPLEIATLLYNEAVKVAPDWETRLVTTDEGEIFQEWPGVSEEPEG
jgi:hypothetical protein